MDISKIAAYFIYCSEDVTGGNDIYCHVELKNAYDKDGLFASYKQFIQENIILQQKFAIKKDKVDWKPLDKQELERLLEIEKKRLSYYHKEEDVYEVYTPTNKTLPVKIYPINRKQMVFAFNHVYTNGYGVLYWLNEWLKYALYKGKEEDIELSLTIPIQKRNYLKRIFYGVSSMINAICYILSFRKNAGNDFYKKSIHCLQEDYSISRKQGYEFVTYRFNEKETSIIIKKAKFNQQTISGYFTGILCKVLYEKYPDKDRICVAYPFDMRKELGLSDRNIGNYTSNIVIQVFRHDHIDKQIRDQYEFKNKGIPFGIANLMRIIYTEKNLHDDITDNCRKKFEERKVEQLSPFIFSNLGKINYPLIKHLVDKITFYLKCQSIIFGCNTLNNKLSISASFSKDIYHADEVIQILNEVFIKAKVFKETSI